MTRRRNAASRQWGQRNILIVIGVALVAILVCTSTTLGSIFWVARSLFSGDDSTAELAPAWRADSAELSIAVSPVMAPVLQELANGFNSRDNRTTDRQKMVVRIVPMQPERMIQEAAGLPAFQAISPDSSLWLDQLDQLWQSRTATRNGSDSQIPISQSRISISLRYAVSPVVIAAWAEVAQDLGWPDQPVGWQEIQRKATEDADFRWNHSSTNNASGLLATLAEFYAGAGLTRGLTEEAATAQSTLDYVQAVEATVRFYGEGEEVIVQRLAEEGRSFLDAFVAQERVVIDWNNRFPTRPLVAMYPAEGTLWTDHPLALLELGSQPHEQTVTENQRQTYDTFAEFLLGSETQRQLLASGYRPADLTIDLSAPGSPFYDNDAVNWREPQTTLQMPSPSVINVVRNVWYYTKRPTNVYLVVDTSGSMDGRKMARTRDALRAFVEQIQGDRDQVGIVEFASDIKNFVPLRVMDEPNRRDTLRLIDRMEAYGGTALIDAVYDAMVDILQQGDDQAINAIVVMTDGQDNESNRRLADLQRLITAGNSVPLVVFTIGFGSDADQNVLSEMARIGQGQYRHADETDIEELYRLISTYF
jgi:Ca-activated chloride channel homolog